MKEWTSAYYHNKSTLFSGNVELMRQPRIHILKIDAEGQDLNVRLLMITIDSVELVAGITIND